MTEAVVTTRALKEHQWQAAMSLATRAFLDEPFMVGMFGAEPVQRFALADRLYRSVSWSEEARPLGAFVGDVLVGFCLRSLPGRCHVCLHTEPTRPPADPTHVVDWTWEVNVQAAHADQGAHAWISRVAVEPALRGAGIGRRLVAETLELLRGEEAAVVLLECQPHREDFYVAGGFHRVRAFADPTGPDALLMRADLQEF